MNTGILLGTALVFMATPTPAAQTITYFGAVLLEYQTSNGVRDPDALDGTYAFAATFRY
ncbi:MAG: hypothetical protein H7039_14635, partial [Bryobacteraceae bacterium]|nr:hypothetical protein [Bryobacteraceae bacterium]